MRICDLPDCARRHKGNGLCDMHLQRLKRTGTTDSPVKTLAERFWPKVDTSGGPEACWPWTAAVNDSGYGVMRPEGCRTGPVVKAHRVSMELAGTDPTGMFVLHSCDNPPCVNPAHLSVGTPRDNVEDMVSRKRQAVGVMRSVKLTDADVVEIRRRVAQGEMHRVIAEDFGVSRSRITTIGNRRGWAHVE